MNEFKKILKEINNISFYSRTHEVNKARYKISKNYDKLTTKEKNFLFKALYERCNNIHYYNVNYIDKDDKFLKKIYNDNFEVYVEIDYAKYILESY